MERVFDASFLNTVANHPTVRPFIGGKAQVLDLSILVDDPENYALAFDHGGFVAVKKSAGVYDFHTLFLPCGRGAAVLKAAREALAFMFGETDCRELVTTVPKDNKVAAIMATAMRMTKAASDEVASQFVLTKDQWSAR